MPEPHLTIRLAVPKDAAVLRRLAVLDSAPPLRGDVLLAEADGVPLAAISVRTGLVAADPFHHTTAAVLLLRLRRHRLVRESAHSGARVARTVAAPGGAAS
jgi:hypothetical protein